MSDQTSPPSSLPNEAQNAAPSTQKEKKKAKKPTNVVIPPKKPKLSKAERRALQEAQRAAKAGGGNTGGANGGGGDRGGKGGEGEASASGGVEGSAKRSRGKSVSEGDNDGAADGGNHERRDDDGGEDKMVSLFSHLPRPKAPLELSVSSNDPSSDDDLHPAVPTLGHLYATRSLMGGNARCRAMLQAFALLLRSYSPPPSSRDFRRDVDHSLLKPAFQYWTTRCRTHSVSMGNAFSFLKLAVANLERDSEWEDARDALLEGMEAYVEERIEYAGRAISRHAGSKIRAEGEVILTFGRSEVVNRLLLDAALEDKKDFHVIVADSRPLLEGRDTLRILSRAGIRCTYVLLNALSYSVMGGVTKVFLGASALMSNGAVLSRVGTACVALLAGASHVPVLVACETYKICSRVQLESITGNELGDADEVARTDCARTGPSDRGGEDTGEKDVLADWKDQPNLKLLNLMYDLTPSDFVTGIVTEVGILPPSSVAVLLREMSPESAFNGTS